MNDLDNTPDISDADRILNDGTCPHCGRDYRIHQDAGDASVADGKICPEEDCQDMSHEHNDRTSGKKGN